MRKRKKKKSCCTKGAELIEGNGNKGVYWLDLCAAMQGSVSKKAMERTKNSIHTLDAYFDGKGQELMRVYLPNNRKEIEYFKLKSDSPLDKLLAEKHDGKKVERWENYGKSANKSINRSLEKYPNDPIFLKMKIDTRRLLTMD